jgi:hypothetical protein
MRGNSIKRTHSSRGRGIRIGLLVVLLVAMFAFPAFAAAQGPTEDQYGGTDRNVDHHVSDPGGLADPVGPLPFTGFDVIAMAAVALSVTGIGLALQRAVARETTNQS